MGLFNSYLKEGPGIDKNAPKKKGIFLFFDVMWRKFFNLIKANVLYFLVSLPFFAIALLLLAPNFTYMVFGDMYQSEEQVRIMLDLFFAGFIFNYFGSGPASAAYAYVTREFTRGKPVWVASDGFDAFKENFKYSMFICIIDIVFMLLVVNAIMFYRSNAGSLGTLLMFIVMFVFFIYAVSHMFMYQIIVTYNCKFSAVIKNALIMTMAKLPMCILLTIITGAICALVFGYLGFVSIIVYALIGLTFTRFPLEFYAARVIEKNIAITEKNKPDMKEEEEK